MSRADREKSLYIIRLNQIREELRSAFPEEFKELKEATQEETGFTEQMHGLTALDQINEKVKEEDQSGED